MSYFTKFPKTEYQIAGQNGPAIIPDIFRQIKVNDARYDSLTPYQYYEVGEDRPDQLSYKLYGTTEYYWTFFIINNNLKEGHNSWYMSDEAVNEYVSEKYKGHAITAYRTGNQSINFNSIAGRFSVGTVLTGSVTGATATVTNRAPEVNQLWIEYQDNKRFNGSEIITSPSGFSIQPSYRVDELKDSVMYYVDEQGEKVSNYDNFYLPSDLAISYLEHEKQINEDRRYIRVLRSDYVRDFTVVYRKVLNG